MPKFLLQKKKKQSHGYKLQNSGKFALKTNHV